MVPLKHYPIPNMYQSCLSCLIVLFPKWCSNNEYEEIYELECQEERRQNVDHIL